MTRARLYAWFRKAHLYTGLALASFVVMYFVTGYPMIHHDLLDKPDPVVSTRAVTVSQPPGEPLADYHAWLQDELDLSGKRTVARRFDDGRHRFEFWRPGTLHRVDIAADGAATTIESRQVNLHQTLVGFHRMHNYGGGWLYDLWVVFYDLASLAMILFAVSGIWLWWRLTQRRVWGWLCLALSWGFCAYTVAWLMYSP